MQLVQSCRHLPPSLTPFFTSLLSEGGSGGSASERRRFDSAAESDSRFVTGGQAEQAGVTLHLLQGSGTVQSCYFWQADYVMSRDGFANPAVHACVCVCVRLCALI